MTVSAAFTTTDWMQDALCAQVGGDLWFPEGQGATAAPAKNICARCPVASPCLQYALDNNFGYSIYAGTNIHQRNQIKKDTP